MDGLLDLGRAAVRTGVGDRFIGEFLNRFGRQALVALLDRVDDLPEDPSGRTAIRAGPRQAPPHGTVHVVGFPCAMAEAWHKRLTPFNGFR